MTNKYNFFLALILTVLVTSCGYKNINLESKKPIFIKNIKITGERRIGNLQKNEIIMISSPKSEAIISLNLNTKKAKKIKEKNSAGKIVKHSLSIENKIEVIDVNGILIINKTIINEEDYIVATTHTQTRINEKATLKSLISKNSDEIKDFINFYLKSQ